MAKRGFVYGEGLRHWSKNIACKQREKTAAVGLRYDRFRNVHVAKTARRSRDATSLDALFHQVITQPSWIESL